MVSAHEILLKACEISWKFNWSNFSLIFFYTFLVNFLWKLESIHFYNSTYFKKKIYIKYIGTLYDQCWFLFIYSCILKYSKYFWKLFSKIFWQLILYVLWAAQIYIFKRSVLKVEKIPLFYWKYSIEIIFWKIVRFNESNLITLANKILFVVPPTKIIVELNSKWEAESIFWNCFHCLFRIIFFFEFLKLYTFEAL